MEQTFHIGTVDGKDAAWITKALKPYTHSIYLRGDCALPSVDQLRSLLRVTSHPSAHLQLRVTAHPSAR